MAVKVNNALHNEIEARNRQRQKMVWINQFAIAIKYGITNGEKTKD